MSKSISTDMSQTIISSFQKNAETICSSIKAVAENQDNNQKALQVDIAAIKVEIESLKAMIIQVQQSIEKTKTAKPAKVAQIAATPATGETPVTTTVAVPKQVNVYFKNKINNDSVYRELLYSKYSEQVKTFEEEKKLSKRKTDDVPVKLWNYLVANKMPEHAIIVDEHKKAKSGVVINKTPAENELEEE